jgi:hypothetical protein
MIAFEFGIGLGRVGGLELAQQHIRKLASSLLKRFHRRFFSRPLVFLSRFLKINMMLWIDANVN